MMVNQEMTDESNWIWLTSEQMGFPLRSEFANENHGEAGSSKQCNDQRTEQTAFLLAPIITDFIQNTKRELYDEKLEDALEMLDFEWSKDDDNKTQCNRLNASPLHRGNASNKNGPARVKRRMQWEAPSKPLAIDLSRSSPRAACFLFKMYGCVNVCVCTYSPTSIGSLFLFSFCFQLFLRL